MVHTSCGKRKQFPLVWAIMSRRRAADYVIVFEELRRLMAEHSLSFTPEAFMMDFEMGKFEGLNAEL